MGETNCSSVLKEDVSSLTEQMMTFLPRRLAVRYMLERGKRNRCERFYADILDFSVEQNQGGQCGLLRLKCTATCGTVLESSHSLYFSRVRDNEIGVVKGVSRIINEWKKKVAEHPHFEPWLKPREFVGVLKFDDEKPREFSEHNPLFAFYHALLATRIAYHVEEIKEVILVDKNLSEMGVGPVRRMSDRFSAFAAQSRHLFVGTILGE